MLPVPFTVSNTPPPLLYIPFKLGAFVIVTTPTCPTVSYVRL